MTEEDAGIVGDTENPLGTTVTKLSCLSVFED